MSSLVVISVLLILYAAVSKPLDHRGVTAALVLMLVGLLTGASVFGWLDLPLTSANGERVAEIALALLLFSDAARIDLPALENQMGWPTRLLLIGLPLTMLAGAGVGALLFPSLSLVSVVLLSIMLAPTDAALGLRVVTDDAVPARVRLTLNVESGLNDGLAVPFFLVVVDIALAELHGNPLPAVVNSALEQIGYGLVAGVAAGLVGAGLVRLAEPRDWLESPWRELLTLSTAVLAYAGAQSIGGSGFIAAFVAGLTFGRVAGASDLQFLSFSEGVGDWLACVVWIGFGALALGAVLPDLTWQIVLYAALSLSLIRMVPVALAMVGSGAERPTIAFMGWFGPRGLASIVFGLIAYDDHVPDARILFTTVTATVALSVIVHGLTSGPLIGVYHRWYAAHAAEAPDAEEAAPAVSPRFRRQKSQTRPAPDLTTG